MKYSDDINITSLKNVKCRQRLKEGCNHIGLSEEEEKEG